MVAIKYTDLEFAFDYVSFGMVGDHNAYLGLDTGKFHYTSESGDDDEDLPDDLELTDRYLALPHKNELELGKQLVRRFARDEMFSCYEEIDDIFRRRGAYARFKEFLVRKGALQRWYDYEQAATKKALLEWCSENGVELIESTN